MLIQRFKVLILLLASGILTSLQAQVRNQEISPNEVTVFLNGATLFKTTALNLSKGSNTIRISGLPKAMISNSFQLSLSDSIQLISLEEVEDSTFAIQAIKWKASLNDSLEELGDRLNVLYLDKEALEIERRVFTENINRIGGQGVQTAQLVMGSQTYRQQLNSIHSRLSQVVKQIRLLQKQIDRIQGQKTNSGRKDESQTIEFVVESKLAFSWKLKYQYAVQAAGWEPTYTIRTTTGRDEIDFSYQAKIFNQTGETWNKTRLSLKLQELELNMERPKLETWEINAFNNYDKKNEEGKISRFRIKQKAVSDTFTPSYVSMEISTTAMVLPEKYTIPFGTRSIQVPVRTKVFPASFIYMAVPKLDEQVYKIGRITKWEDMNLMDGTLFVFSDRQFVGTSVLELGLSMDTLELYCGTSKYISLNRAKRKNTGNQKMIGTNQVSELGYEIAVKNNGVGSVLLKLVDQIPVTSDPNIKIEAEETGGASLDKDSGKLEWLLSLKPGESKIIPFAFTVKYPKSSHVNLKQYRKASPAKFR